MSCRSWYSSYECDGCGVVQSVDPREFKGQPPAEQILAANYEWRVVTPHGWGSYSTNPNPQGRHLCPKCK